MTRTDSFRALMAIAAMILALCLVALVGIKPAEAAFSGANGKVAFESVRDTWVKNASLSSPETKLLDEAVDVAYSPDGSRIAFSRESPGVEIFVGRADGKGTPRKLTSNTVLDDNPAWSPDGTQIVYESGSQIWVMNADGSAKRQLSTKLSTGDPAFDPAGQSFYPAWSVPLPGAPDGKIAFSHKGSIWTMLADGNNKAELDYTCPQKTGGICDPAIYPPTFSPNGKRIASHYLGDIFTVSSSGGTSTSLLRGPEDTQPIQEQFPTWSPDGKKIAFQASPARATAAAIYVAPSGGTTDRPTRITSNNPGDEDPEWLLSRPRCGTTDGERNEALDGTSGNDTILGTAKDDVICGLGGNDTINGRGGDDVILGDDGNDRLIGTIGRDTLNGGAGRDTASFSGSAEAVNASLITGFAQRLGTSPLSGVALVGIENLTGSSANDRLTGSSVTNVLVGGNGADALFGLGGNDTLNSKDGVNRNDTLNGGAGTDTCIKDATEASITGCP